MQQQNYNISPIQCPLSTSVWSAVIEVQKPTTLEMTEQVRWELLDSRRAEGQDCCLFFLEKKKIFYLYFTGLMLMTLPDKSRAAIDWISHPSVTPNVTFYFGEKFES